MKETVGDSVLYELAPITVTALRYPEINTEIPVSISVVDKITIATARQQLSLTESLGTIPGVFGLNATNFAQDLRIAIRGFGARAAFGIRGIKIIMDGIPETTPDGQTQLDNLNLSIIDRIEILRGPASALYGNASGGVINLTSMHPPAKPYAESRITAGSFGFRQLQVQTGKKMGAWDYVIAGATNRIRGFRENSAMENYLYNSILRFTPDTTSQMAVRIGFEESPVAKDPGALTREEALEIPEAANRSSLIYNTGEEVTQGRAGLYYRKRLNVAHEIRFTMYYAKRIFNNRLAFTEGGTVDLNRNYAGGTGLYDYFGSVAGFRIHVQSGVDIAWQSDHRRRFDNQEGRLGITRFNQMETFVSSGAFLQSQLHLNASWNIYLGGRYDRIHIQANDRFPQDGDDSGHRKFFNTNGMIGLLFKFKPVIHFYTHISSGSETPALIELSSNPYSSGGFNLTLKSQRSVNYEAGIKGRLLHRVQYEAAVFRINLENELLPFEVEGIPGRTYYRNAGASVHQGAELGLNGKIAPGITLSVAYTWSDFYFRHYSLDDRVLDAKNIPGIPMHHAFAELFYVHTSGLYSRLEWHGTGTVYTDDANTSTAPEYHLVHFQAGFRRKYSSVEIEPFMGIHNMFNRRYFDNIRINAFAQRYFEPAPGRSLFAGVSFRIIPQ